MNSLNHIQDHDVIAQADHRFYQRKEVADYIDRKSNESFNKIAESPSEPWYVPCLKLTKLSQPLTLGIISFMIFNLLDSVDEFVDIGFEQSGVVTTVFYPFYFSALLLTVSKGKFDTYLFLLFTCLNVISDLFGLSHDYYPSILSLINNILIFASFTIIKHQEMIFFINKADILNWWLRACLFFFPYVSRDLELKQISSSFIPIFAMDTLIIQNFGHILYNKLCAVFLFIHMIILSFQSYFYLTASNGFGDSYYYMDKSSQISYSLYVLMFTLRSNRRLKDFDQGKASDESKLLPDEQSSVVI